jgi:hypothetical protein
MIPESIPVLHVGEGLSGQAYLFRVAVSLVGIGGVALSIHWVLTVIDTVRSAVSADSAAE